MAPQMIAIMGCTASGKTLIAEALAEQLDAQLINADAFMVYRGLDIGTNKPTRKSAYELLDLCEPTHQFGLGAYLRAVQPVLERLWDQRRSAIFVGGTGLYIRALFERWSDLQPEPPEELRRELRERLDSEGLELLVAELRSRNSELADKTDLKNPQRVTRALERTLAPLECVPAVEYPPFTTLKLGVSVDIDDLNARIELRTGVMLDAGWREEVLNLLESGVPVDSAGFKAIGYSEIAQAWRGKESWESVRETIVRRTIQYAKRQRTWLRSEPGIRMLTVLGPHEAISSELQKDLGFFFR